MSHQKDVSTDDMPETTELTLQKINNLQEQIQAAAQIQGPIDLQSLTGDDVVGVDTLARWVLFHLLEIAKKEIEGGASPKSKGITINTPINFQILDKEESSKKIPRDLQAQKTTITSCGKINLLVYEYSVCTTTEL